MQLKCCFFCGPGTQTRVLIHTRQALHCWANSPAFLLLFYTEETRITVPEIWKRRRKINFSLWTDKKETKAYFVGTAGFFFLLLHSGFLPTVEITGLVILYLKYLCLQWMLCWFFCYVELCTTKYSVQKYWFPKLGITTVDGRVACVKLLPVLLIYASIWFT